MTLAVNRRVEGVPWFSSAATAPVFCLPRKEGWSREWLRSGEGLRGRGEASAGAQGAAWGQWVSVFLHLSSFLGR